MRRSESPDHHRIGGHEPDRPTSDHQGSIRVWDCGSPLYDSYELAAVNHLLERHMMILTPSHGSTETVTATPSEKARPGNGKCRAEAGPLSSSTSTSAARSLGRRLWKRLQARGRNNRDDDDDDSGKKKGVWKVLSEELGSRRRHAVQRDQQANSYWDMYSISVNLIRKWITYSIFLVICFYHHVIFGCLLLYFSSSTGVTRLEWKLRDKSLIFIN